MIVSLIENALLTRSLFWLLLSMDSCCSSYLFNPSEIIHSIEEVQQEFKELKQDADYILVQQEEIRRKIDEQFSSVCKKMTYLEKKVGPIPKVENVERSASKKKSAAEE